MADKKVILDYGEVGINAYLLLRREVDDLYLNATQTFEASPASFPVMVEDTLNGGRYAITITAVLNDGRYTATIKKCLGGSQAPTTDTNIGSGEMFIVGDTEVVLDTSVSTMQSVLVAEHDTTQSALADVLSESLSHPTLAEIEASTVLAKQAKIDFIQRWILNKLVESPTGTWKLYDDDNVTVLKTWTWDTATKTRSKST